MKFDLFNKTEIRISVRQAEIMLDLFNKLDMREMSTEEVYAANSLYYSLLAVKNPLEAEEIR
jgi:hypothetical protein